MKRLALLSVLCACVCYSQTYYINVRLKGGGTTSIPIRDIQRITFSFSQGGITGNEDAGKYAPVIKTFCLLQNYPNPFNPNTTIRFELPRSGNVEIRIFNVAGQLVRTLEGSFLAPGAHAIVWDGKSDGGQSVGSGAYLYQIAFDNTLLTRKMLLLK